MPYKDPVAHRANSRKWVQNNPEKHRANRKKWLKDHPECGRTKHQRWEKRHPEKVKLSRKIRTLKRYGLSLEEFHQMFENQEGLCAICSQPLCLCTKKCSEKAVVDHNHKTHQVRGLLHDRCNRGIGALNDSPVLLQNALNYVK